MKGAIGLVLLAGGALAEPVPLSGPEISEALTGRVLVYEDSAWQRFDASGETLYVAGGESLGRWEVRGNQYCSHWPPAERWACYDVARDGAAIRFVGAGGDVTDGRYR